MITNIEEFINSINYKGLNNRGNIYAQIIKGERLRQNKTLEEVASGICSISYLCKLENYMIYPPQNLVKQVFEKMNITYGEINEDNLENVLDDSIKDFFYKNEYNIFNNYLKIKEYKASPQVILIKCLYNLLKKNYKEVANDVSHLDEIKDTLGGIEAITLILVTIYYYIYNCNYKKAYMLLKCTDYLKVDNKYIKYLFFNANLYTAFHLRDNSRFIKLYLKIDDYEYLGFPMDKRIIFRLMFDILNYEDFPIESVYDFESINLNNYNDVILDELMYYKSIIYINAGKYIDVFKEISDSKYVTNPKFLGILSVCAYCLNQKMYYDKLLEIINDNSSALDDSNSLVIHKVFIYLVLMYGVNSNKDELNEYIKDEVLKISEKCCDYLYSKIIEEIFVSLLSSQHHYKEAYLYLKSLVDFKYNKNI